MGGGPSQRRALKLVRQRENTDNAAALDDTLENEHTMPPFKWMGLSSETVMSFSFVHKSAFGNF